MGPYHSWGSEEGGCIVDATSTAVHKSISGWAGQTVATEPLSESHNVQLRVMILMVIGCQHMVEP